MQAEALKQREKNTKMWVKRWMVLPLTPWHETVRGRKHLVELYAEAVRWCHRLKRLSGCKLRDLCGDGWIPLFFVIVSSFDAKHWSKHYSVVTHSNQHTSKLVNFGPGISPFFKSATTSYGENLYGLWCRPCRLVRFVRVHTNVEGPLRMNPPDFSPFYTACIKTCKHRELAVCLFSV